MKIVGHRGAAGLALENTLASFAKALEVGVDMIEFDIRVTADGQLAISHGDHLARLGGGDHRVSKLTAQELGRVTLEGGAHVPLLREVLALIDGKVPVIIEIKTSGALELLLKEMEQFPNQAFSVASPKHDEIKRLKQLRPDIKGYPRAICNPLLAIYRAKRGGGDGIDLYDWWLIPFYYPCQWLGLDIMIFTVNTKWIGTLIGKFFPHIMLCTNYPNLFIKP